MNEKEEKFWEEQERLRREEEEKFWEEQERLRREEELMQEMQVLEDYYKEGE